MADKEIKDFTVQGSPAVADKLLIQQDADDAVRYTTLDDLSDAILGRAVNVGGASHHTAFAADGEINLIGTARVTKHVRIGARQWAVGSSPPDAGSLGLALTHDFDASADEEVHFALMVPHRMVAGTDIDVEVGWAYTGGADAGTVIWALEYTTIAAGEDMTGGSTTRTKTSAGSHGNNALVLTTFATGVQGAVAEDVLNMRLYRDTDSDTLAVDAQLVEVRLHFTMDKLGEAT